MMGRLYVFEGIDGCGKTTQFHLLCKALEKAGIEYRTLDYPRYGKPSCTLVEQYLRGDFGKKPGDVNAYTASAFFAVDRAASFLEDWGEYYKSGGLLIANRYTTSNVLHQGAKMPQEEQLPFFKWLYEFEFSQLGLPKPDAVFYLDVPLEVSVRQMRRREQLKNTKADIHEQDNTYLAACRACGETAVEHLGWHRVQCVKDGVMLPPEEIHKEVWQEVLKRQK
ncbi:MAG: thymidylate kinase [Oscillospiraceae bacterium]|nr:thymidylate kinase [Oscillospiraceae bacterium]